MLAHLKIFWQFHQKCRDFLGRDILGTTFFRAESSFLTNMAEHIVEGKQILRFVFVIRVIVPYVL
jgi:hypothetical protein